MTNDESTGTNKIYIDTGRRRCKACGLYLNQLPVLDKGKKSNVFWVGLSSVLITDEDEKIPLSPFTKTGALISQIEDPFRNDISFYKTNVVKCLPLMNNKIRYPLKHEMEKMLSQPGRRNRDTESFSYFPVRQAGCRICAQKTGI